MNIKEYQEKAARTCVDLPHFENELHMILGMVTESAELATVYKNCLAYNKEIDIYNVVEELGDLLWFIVNFCRMNEIDIEEVLDININKLMVRYPEAFTKEKAINRDLKSERDVLEGKVRVMMPGGTITEINAEDLDV